MIFTIKPVLFPSPLSLNSSAEKEEFCIYFECIFHTFHLQIPQLVLWVFSNFQTKLISIQPTNLNKKERLYQLNLPFCDFPLKKYKFVPNNSNFLD